LHSPTFENDHKEYTMTTVEAGFALAFFPILGVAAFFLAYALASRLLK
jgi:hypothetical protein